MNQSSKPKQYDLEDRTFRFSQQVIVLARSIKKDLVIYELCKQVVRSACSIGANYIEANESLGKKDFAMRIRICRKEAKETQYWLRLIASTENKDLNRLANEAIELMKIFGAILTKV